MARRRWNPDVSELDSFVCSAINDGAFDEEINDAIKKDSSSFEEAINSCIKDGDFDDAVSSRAEKLGYTPPKEE